MIRTQVSFTDEQLRRLRAEARRRHVPIAQVVREAVDRAVPVDPGEREARFRRAMTVAGRFDSSTRDLAARHDEIAGESEW